MHHLQPQSLGHAYLPAATISAGLLQVPKGISEADTALSAFHTAAAQYMAAAEANPMPTALRDAVGAAVNAAFDSGCTALQADHAALLDTETNNARVLNNR